jgi:hypothetical protein
MTPSEIEVLRTLLEFIFLPVFGWMVKRMDSLAKVQATQQQSINDIGTTLREMRVALIGLDGQNGIRSEVKHLQHDIKEIRENLP